MSYTLVPKEKLAEALLRYSSSTANYEVIPPAPSNSLGRSSDSISSRDSYVSEFVPSAAIMTRGQAEPSGYGFLVSNGYFSSPVHPTNDKRDPKDGDYYLSSSTNLLASSGSTTGENNGRLAARRLADRLAQDMHLNRDYNKDYQVLMEAIEARNDDMGLLTELRLLTKDFLDTAQSVGCIIIDELFEPSKTIPPVDIGGIAGGVKYVYRNILYKICLDTQLDENRGWMHGGDKPSHEKAMKTGAHELRGLMHYSSLRVSGLHFPLMLVMDYKGFRLVAEALLPINKETIRYGSSDGGESVHAAGDTLCQMMKTVGQQLHLAPHIVKDKTLFGPGDQEVHHGLDGRYYCIDLARVFPCEPARHHLTPSNATNSNSRISSSNQSSSLQLSVRPSTPTHTKHTGSTTPLFDEPRSIFYKFFRPEFILSYKKPLACDCFTAWGRNDPAFQQLNKDVVDAFLHLRSFIIPKYASDFDKTVSALPRPTNAWNWWSKYKPLERLHEAGVNIRHLGLVRLQCVNEFARALLLNEMIARVLKNLIRKQLREESQSRTKLSNEQVKDVVTEFYNWVLGKGSSPLLRRSLAQSSAQSNIVNTAPLHRSGPIFNLGKSSDSASSASSSETDSASLDYRQSASASSIPMASSPINIQPATVTPTFGFGQLPRSPCTFVIPNNPNDSSSPKATFSNNMAAVGTSPNPIASPPQNSTSNGMNASTISASPSITEQLILDAPSEIVTSFPDAFFLQQFYFQFESGLLREEAKDPVNTIRKQIDYTLLFLRLNQMLGIEMDSEAAKELQHTSSYEFVHCDLSSMAPKVRFMNLVDEAEGLALFITAKQKKHDQRSRLLKLSTSKFQASCASLPHNFHGLFYWGRSLYEEAKMITGDRRERIRVFELALSKLELVTKLRIGHFKAWMIQVRIWFKLFETEEYLERIGDHHVTDLVVEDFSFLTDNLVTACTHLMRLNIFWVDKLLRKARTIFAQAQSKTGQPTSLLKIVGSICFAIQAVCGPMMDAYPSVPLPPDAIQIKLPRIHVESLLLCARSLQIRSVLANARASAPKPQKPSRGSQQLGINHDELQSKRLKFQIAEQFTAALETKYHDDAPHLDRLLIESLTEIFPLIKSSKSLGAAFQERCRQICEVNFSSTSTATIINNTNKGKSAFIEASGSPNPNRTSGPGLAPKSASSDTISLISSSPIPSTSSKEASSSSSTVTSSGSFVQNYSSASTLPNPNSPMGLFIELALPHVGPRLTTIDVSGSKNVPVEVLSRLFSRSVATLTYLDLSELTGATETWLQSATAKLTNLQHLKVRELKISDDTAVMLCSHHGAQLLTLDISSNRLSNYGLYKMAKELKCLQTLDLSKNSALGVAHPKVGIKSSDFSDAMTWLRPSLTSLSMLECYQLANQAVWDIGKNLRNLRHLSLTTKTITDQYLMKLEHVALKLETLELRSLSNQDPPFIHLLQHLSSEHCRSVSLRACMGITDATVEVLQHCTNLQVLNLGLCLLVRGDSLKTLSSSVHSLVELDLSGMSIQPTIVSQFITSQTNLEVLHIPQLTNPLTDQFFIPMLSYIPKLRELNLESSERLSIKSLESLVHLTPLLESLNLADCHGLHGDLERLLLRLKSLIYLNIRFAHRPGEHPSHFGTKMVHIPTLVVCSCSNRPVGAKTKKGKF